MKFFTGFITLSCCLAFVAVQSATAQSTRPTTRDDGINLALAATASTSFVSGDQSTANLNNGFNPRRSNDSSHGAYGNWPHVGTEWVEYDWSQPVNVDRIAVYWFADGQGIRLPKASRLSYWNGSSFVSVEDAQGLGVAGNTYNLTQFTPVTTSKLRLEFDSGAAGMNFSTGILQWKVFDAGGSPNFPPIVKAGDQRVVVTGASTYFNPSIRDIKGEPTDIAWSKASGPGDVTFADASGKFTSAQFSQPGDYEVKLTAGTGSLLSSDTVAVRVIAPEPSTHMQPVYTQSYKINSTFWNPRIKTTIVNWIPHCYTELSDLKMKEGGIANFIEAGKKLSGNPTTQPIARHVGYPFANAYVYNTVESMYMALLVDPQGDAEIIKAQDDMRKKLDEWIPIILAAQEPDGYIQTRFTLDPRNAPHWDSRYRGEHEGYTQGYFIEAGIASYMATGGKDLRLYNAARKCADCWCANLGPAPKKAWYDGHEEMEQAMVRLGRFVNDTEGAGKGQKYIDLAKFLLDSRYSATTGGAYDQTLYPVTQQYSAMGHAVRAVYLYSAMTDVAMETGNLDYQSAVNSIWDDLINRKYYVTGGVGSGETSEGFGGDYSLRNNSYCESCSGCGELFFQFKMNLDYGDSKYADLYEGTLYNAILGDLALDGKTFTYTNELEFNPRNGRAFRYDWHTCPCCVGNIPRVMLQLPTWMYTRNSDSIDVNLFVGSTVTVPNIAGADVQMVQTTDYPWSNKAAIVVNPGNSRAFTVRVRVPDRQVSALYTAVPEVKRLDSISVNGETVEPEIQNGYAVITRTWKDGDKIELTLPMTVQKLTADNRVMADRGRMALQYGPLIYNLENVDQEGKLDSSVDLKTTLTANWKPDLLGGVMAINGSFADGSPLQAIPNYARCNRGGRSLVWMKDQ